MHTDTMLGQCFMGAPAWLACDLGRWLVKCRASSTLGGEQ